MKRVLFLLLAVVFLITLSACVEVVTYDELDQEYKTYVSNNRELYSTYMDYFNELSTKTVQSVVQVRKNTTPSLSSGTGTGVIFAVDATYYYVLTNNHVIYSTSSSVTYQIVDYKGGVYNATLYAYDDDYDLAIIRFRKYFNVLPLADFAIKNPEPENRIAVIGYPNFQINAIVIGKTEGYQRVNIETNGASVSINVDFDVMITTASVKSGSSGSPVFDRSFRMVGIIYAGNFSTNSDVSVYSFVIPIEKVREFISTQGLQMGDS